MLLNRVLTSDYYFNSDLLNIVHLLFYYFVLVILLYLCQQQNCFPWFKFIYFYYGTSLPNSLINVTTAIGTYMNMCR